MDVFFLLQDYSTEIVEARKKDLKKHLAHYLNHLLLHDFGLLVQLLYKVDVPEENLKKVLKENPETEAGILLADLLLKRVEEKKNVRSTFRSSTEESEEEKW